MLLNVQKCGKKGMQRFMLYKIILSIVPYSKLARILHFFNKGKIPKQPLKNFWWNSLLATDFYSCLKSFSVSTAMKHFYLKIFLSCSEAFGFWCTNSLWISDIKNQTRACPVSVRYMQSILKLLHNTQPQK